MNAETRLHSKEALRGTRGKEKLCLEWESCRPYIPSLPSDVMFSCDLCEKDVLLSGPKALGIKQVVIFVVARASGHLIATRTMLKSVKRSKELGLKFEYTNDEGHEYSKYESVKLLSGQLRQEEFKKGFGIVMRPAGQ